VLLAEQQGCSLSFIGGCAAIYPQNASVEIRLRFSSCAELVESHVMESMAFLVQHLSIWEGRKNKEEDS